MKRIWAALIAITLLCGLLAWCAVAGQQNVFISGHGAGAQVTWSLWNEASERTLAVDQDGDGAEDTFVVFFENTSAGGNETGWGVLSGANLVFTQDGNVAGAVGSPPYRVLDGANDRFFYTTTFMTSMFNGQGAWTLLMKFADVSPNTKSLFQARRSTPPAYGWDVYGGGSGNLTVQCSPSGAGGDFTLDTSTAAAMPTSGALYVAVWFDGTYWRAGFSATRPTKWSDFSANNRISATTGTQWNCAFDGGKYLAFGDASHPAAKAYYVVASKKCLIDNGS